MSARQKNKVSFSINKTLDILIDKYSKRPLTKVSKTDLFNNAIFFYASLFNEKSGFFEIDSFRNIQISAYHESKKSDEFNQNKSEFLDIQTGRIVYRAVCIYLRLRRDFRKDFGGLKKRLPKLLKTSLRDYANESFKIRPGSFNGLEGWSGCTGSKVTNVSFNIDDDVILSKIRNIIDSTGITMSKFLNRAVCTFVHFQEHSNRALIELNQISNEKYIGEAIEKALNLYTSIDHQTMNILIEIAYEKNRSLSGVISDCLRYELDKK